MARPRLPGELTWPKLIGTGLAAVVAAWVAGHLGAGNTLAGAAVGSVVATFATAFFSSTIHHGTTMLVRTEHGTLVQASVSDTVPSPEETDPEVPNAPWWKRLHWGAIAAASALTLVLALLTITVYEAAVGRTWGSNEPGTTLGHTFHSDPIVTPTPTPTPTETPTPTPTPTPTETPTPTPTPSPTVVPTPDATPTPVPTPTVTPTPEASTTPTPAAAPAAPAVQ